MPTTPTAPTAVPDFPELSDRATYNARAYAWAVHMDDVYPAEMLALANNTYNNAVEGAASAVTATTQAGLATTNGAAQVVLAEAQVALAQTQAGLATTNGAAQVALAEAQVALAGAHAVATAADAVATAADRVQTGIDAAAADASAIAASKLNLGNKASPPTLDNQGAALLAGATYYDTTLDKWRVWTGVAWGVGISAVSGVSSIDGQTGDVTLRPVESFLFMSLGVI